MPAGLGDDGADEEQAWVESIGGDVGPGLTGGVSRSDAERSVARLSMDYDCFTWLFHTVYFIVYLAPTPPPSMMPNAWRRSAKSLRACSYSLRSLLLSASSLA